ncbi:MAG: tetratricopeptide repeat protein [Verrucomicrobiaceae bacterium]|nr:tetratricopeptide repeat protein [Verrucomicrobiaceae bacterium]
MKKLLTLLAAALPLLAAAQENPPPAAPPSAAELGDAQLSEADQQKLVKIFQDVQEMRKQNRFTDAIAKLDEAEKISPKNGLIFTMRGDIHLAPRRRDFDLAKEQFLKAKELDPNNAGPAFNLAELEFARHDFPTAAAAFRKLVADFPKLPQVIRHLALSRIVICEARQKKFDEAEKLIKESFTFMDDTPAYYFSNAAISFAKKDEKMAQEWMLRATSIFKEQQTGPYIDAFKEMRWLPDVDYQALPDPSAGK